MLEKIYIDKPNHTDLNMYRCGFEDCSPGHFWGPALRDHYIIHFIKNGKGTFTINGTTFTLTRNQGFLIPPNTVIYYEADMLDPWSYSWVGFHGLKADQYLSRAGISALNPIFTYNRDEFLIECIDEMILASKTMIRGSDIKLLGLLYMFLAQLVETNENQIIGTSEENRKEHYIKKAMEFIDKNYSRRISIAEIANFVGLDRSYMYSLFKELLNFSPQDFLIKYRMDKACGLMNNKLLSIGDISRSVGYEDPLLFSRTFRKTKGLSPKDYRKSHS